MRTMMSSLLFFLLLVLATPLFASVKTVAAFSVVNHHQHGQQRHHHSSSSSSLRRRNHITRRHGVRASSRSRRLTRRFMFTGIVEEMGTVISLKERNDMPLWDGSKGTGTELTIRGSPESEKSVVMDGAYLGCSICVSGVCLTATHLDFDKQQFTVGLAPETLRRSNLGQLVVSGGGDEVASSQVNLERASEIGGRNSGHFVQGHVDCTGTILERTPEGDSIVYKVQVDDPSAMAYIVSKGFIAVDGTSLTVVDVDMKEHWFTFMLVEYTQKKIIIPAKMPGEKVNLEVDVLGKYSENALAALVPRITELEQKVADLEKQLQEK